MSGNLDRRLAAVEARTGVGCAQRLQVRHRPDSLDAASRAAWEAADSYPPADLVVVIRHITAPWPPRDASEAQGCLTQGLCADRLELSRRVLAMPAYAEQQGVLAGLHAA